VSPRRRAQRTLELLDLGCHDRLPWQDELHGKSDIQHKAKVQITEDIREWDYGDYEGKTSPQIREERKAAGLPESWDIWRDGCPGGEYSISHSNGRTRISADSLFEDHRRMFLSAWTD
jgi:broad specificity phosphatase PhoE